MSLTHIAKLLGVTKSYVSRVKAGKRSLTLDHLAVLEMELGRSVPLMLMETIPRETVAPKARRLYDATIKLLRRMADPGPWEKRKATPATGRKGKRVKAA